MVQQLNGNHADASDPVLGGVFTATPPTFGVNGKTLRMKRVKLGELKAASDTLMRLPYVPQAEGMPVVLGYVSGLMQSGSENYDELLTVLNAWFSPEVTKEDVEQFDIEQLQDIINAIMDHSGMTWLRTVLGNRTMTGRLMSLIADELIAEQQTNRPGGTDEASPSSIPSSSTSQDRPATPTRQARGKGSRSPS